MKNDASNKTEEKKTTAYDMKEAKCAEQKEPIQKDMMRER